MSINLLQIQNGYKSYATKDLFDDITVSVNLGEHIGIVGANGTGKTTFFKIVIGQEELDSGSVIKSKELKLGYLAQEDVWQKDETITDYIDGLSRPLWELKDLGQSLGLKPEMFDQPIESLSGGYRMRCKLLRLIGKEPNLLLLDEPTNYLDLESLIVLENFLKKYEGAFLLITHDHEFLKKVTNTTIGFQNKKVEKISGNVDFYFEQKQLQNEILTKQKFNQDKKKKQLQDFVTRFGAKNTKAKQAKSKMKQIERMEDIDAPDTFIPKVNIKLPQPIRTGRFTFALEDVNLGYTEQPVISDISFNIERGDHVAVVGYNGAGKSTFLKGLAGHLKPQKGELQIGQNNVISYFGQHVPEELNLTNTILSELHEGLDLSIDDQMVLDIAGALMFSGDDLNKKISVLSGGEKVRVALAKILLKKNSCLLLDEPTNHLDFYTVEALANALNLYEGTVVFVSHDRKFVRNIAQKILIVNKGKLELYPGNYDEYLWSLEKGLLANIKTDDSKEETKTTWVKKETRKPNAYKRKKELERTIRMSEKKMNQLDQDIEKLNLDIASQDSIDEKMKLIASLEDAHHQKNASEEEWLSAQEELESLS